MNNFTLHDVEEPLAQALIRAAEAAQISINQYALDCLRQNLGLKKKPIFTKVYHDLDIVFGHWNEEEYHTIEQHLIDQRRIDEEIWQ